MLKKKLFAFQLTTLFLFFAVVAIAQTTIISGQTVNASSIATGNAVTINANGHLKMDVAKTFASITTANTGTSYIDGTGNLTVTGAITIQSGNTLNLAPNCTSGSLTTKWTSTSNATLSGAGILTTTNVTVESGATSTSSGWLILSGTIACTNINKAGGIGPHNVQVQGTLRISGAISNIDLFRGANSLSSTVEYNGTGPQTIYPTSEATFGYYNLIVTATVPRTITFSTTGTVYIMGPFIPNSNANTFVATGSTVEFSGNGLQTVPALSYHNLNITGYRTTKNVTLGPGTINVAGNFSSTGASFSSGKCLAANDNEIVFNGNGNQTISCPNVTFNNVTANSAGILTLNNDMNINGVLSLTKGVISVSSPNSVKIAATGSINGGSEISYISGKLTQIYNATGSKVFPIGKASIYGPVALKYNTLTGASSVSAEQFVSAFPVNVPYTNIFSTRYWTISQAGGTNFNYDLTLDGTGFSANNTAVPVVVKENSGTAVVLNPTQTGDSYTVTGLTGFSNFGLGAQCSPPTISIQPTARRVINNGDEEFEVSVGASGTGSDFFTYQWEVDPRTGFTDIANGGYYSGANSDKLTVINPTENMKDYAYRVNIGRPCGQSIQSIPVALVQRSPLPLQLVSFTASKCNRDICLFWTTSNEVNVSHFEIERSSNGSHFEKINSMHADNASHSQYNFTDNGALHSINYYRLKMVDADGRFTYSKVVKIDLEKLFTINLYPNPAKNELFIDGMDQYRILEITDAAGQLISLIQINADMKSVNISALKSGIYFAKFRNDHDVQTLKFIKQ